MDILYSYFAEDVEPYRIKLDGTEKSPIVHLDIKEQNMLKRISILNEYWEKQADFLFLMKKELERQIILLHVLNISFKTNTLLN